MMDEDVTPEQSRMAMDTIIRRTRDFEERGLYWVCARKTASRYLRDFGYFRDEFDFGAFRTDGARGGASWGRVNSDEAVGGRGGFALGDGI